mgnify:CR=1 FL=1
MNLVRIIIAALLLVSAVPMEAFCQDEHCATAETPCAVSCHHMVSLDANLPVIKTFTHFIEDRGKEWIA